jgi:hypothetical protein
MYMIKPDKELGLGGFVQEPMVKDTKPEASDEKPLLTLRIWLAVE